MQFYRYDFYDIFITSLFVAGRNNTAKNFAPFENTIYIYIYITIILFIRLHAISILGRRKKAREWRFNVF